MEEYTAAAVATLIEEETYSSLEAMLREGARRMLQAALEMEVDPYIEQCQAQRDGLGHRLVVRNGRHRACEVVTGVGKIPIRQPRVADRRADHHFTSAILPPYLRRTPSIDALIPAKGCPPHSFPRRCVRFWARAYPGYRRPISSGSKHFGTTNTSRGVGGI